MPTKTKTTVTDCPSCGEPIQVNFPQVGHRVSCQSCGKPWEVIWWNPVELDWPFEALHDDNAFEYTDDFRENPDF